MKRYAQILFLLFLFFLSTSSRSQEQETKEIESLKQERKFSQSKLSLELNLTADVIGDNDYTREVGLNVGVYYKVWKNITIGFSNLSGYANCYSGDKCNMVNYNPMVLAGYEYYIFNNRISFALYGLTGVYHRRISSAISDVKNDLYRTYKTNATFASFGGDFKMRFFISNRHNIAAGLYARTTPFTGLGLFPQLGVSYKLKHRTDK